MKKSIIKYLLCAGLIFGNVVTAAAPTMVYATEADSEQSTDNQQPANVTNTSSTDVSNESTEVSEMTEGADKDLTFTNYSVSGNQAGQKVTINFTITANPNPSNRYNIANLKRVFANVDDSFPFETNDEASRVLSVSGNTVNVSYTFTAKDNLETAYYPVAFTVVYDRNRKYKENNIDKTALITDTEYYYTKRFSVKINAKPEVKKEEKKDPEAADTDISIQVNETAEGVYGKNCKVEFVAKSSSCKITNVTPVIGDGFPFETKGDAYKNVTSKGTNSLKCSYNFTVRSDVATGYQGVTFAITYIKDGKTFTANKTMNVHLEGKKEKKKESSGGGDSKSSTPRLMVTGCDTDLEQIYPNDVFVLTVHLKNTAKKAVSNIKVTLASEEKNFISTNGASSAYVESIAAGSTADVTFELQADSSLTAKAYGLTVKTEYEDSKANPYTSEDSLTIPVSLKADMKITEVQVPYDLCVGGEGTLSFTITNSGAATLYNVNVKCEGEDFSCEETYVGNIAAGSSGYASIPLIGEKVTESDGACTITVTYEDNKGNATTVTEPTNIYVMDMAAMDPEITDEEMVEPEKKTVIWPYIVGGIVVIIIIVLVIRRNKKKRKQAEEELIDDDI